MLVWDLVKTKMGHYPYILRLLIILCYFFCGIEDNFGFLSNIFLYTREVGFLTAIPYQFGTWFGLL